MNLLDAGDFPCPQCRAIHGDIRGRLEAGTACRRCRGPAHHHSTAACEPTRISHKLCKRGLLSVRRWKQNDVVNKINTSSRYAAVMLKMFDQEHVLAPSFYISSQPPALECWTTVDGIETLEIIRFVANDGGVLNVCNPVAARLLVRYPDVFGEIRALWKLGADKKVIRMAALDGLTEKTDRGCITGRTYR